MGKRANGEGSVYPRKSDGKWVATAYIDGKRRPFYGDTRKEAMEKRKTALHEYEKGTLVRSSKQTVKDYLEYWLEEVHKPTLRISTYVKYRKLLKYIFPAFGHVQLQKLTPQQVQALYTKLNQKLSAKTVNNVHGLLHKAFNDALKWELIGKNVCTLVSPPRIPKKEYQVVTKAQAHVLLEHVRKHRLEVILLVAVTTGIRRGELLALRWRDVDLENKSIYLQRTVDYIPKYGYVETETKTDAGRRMVMLPNLVVEALKAHRLEQDEVKAKRGKAWIEKDLVFCGLHGDYFNPGYLLRLFKKVLVDAGLAHMRFHDLRHSAATILLVMKVHPKIVQDRLGHSTIKMTMDTYSHVIPSMQDDATDKLENEFGQ